MATQRKRDTPEARIHMRAVAYMRRYLSFLLGPKTTAPFFHCTNEGVATVQYRAKLRRMGLSPGMPDLVIVCETKQGHPGAALEIKAPRGRLSAAQRQWLDTWSGAGFDAVCTWGHRGTADQLLSWGFIGSDEYDEWIAWATAHDSSAL